MWIVRRESLAIVHVPRELSLFGCWRGLFGVRRPGTEKFIGWPCLFTEISALPRAAVQIAQENEWGGKTGLDAGAARSKGRVTKKFLRISNFELFLSLSLAACAAARGNGRPRAEI